MSSAPACHFRFDDVRGLLRLSSELRDLPQGSGAQRLHALRGLASLVGAQVGLWLTIGGSQGGRAPTWGPRAAPTPPAFRGAIDFGWSGPGERSAFHAYFDDAAQHLADPAMPRMLEAMRSSTATRTRDQLVTDGDWYRSEHVHRFRRPAGVDSFIYTAHVGAAGEEVQCISLHRAWGERPFSERERQIVEAFQMESGWLYEPVVSAVPQGNLPPRLHDTLSKLVAGLSEKQVAAEMGLSTHTVHGYVKILYRHFQVSSRAELLARYIPEGPRPQAPSEK